MKNSVQICPISTRDILWLRVNGILIINFYRHAGTSEPFDYLLYQQEVPERCLVAGDFNAHHCSWQPGVTHVRGNTIDLAFANIPAADAFIEEHLYTAQTILRSASRFLMELSLLREPPDQGSARRKR
ncbi:endonuclease-reverse transcriptase domain-containing protein [Hirsutella rhossiliensis]